MGMDIRWVEQRGSVWRLQMSFVQVGRPEISLDGVSLRAWLEKIKEAEDAEIRVLVIEGQAGIFCQGMDLGARLLAYPQPPVEPSSRDEAHEIDVHYTPTPGILRALHGRTVLDDVTASALREDVKRYAALLLALRRASFAVIALVDGEVMAGGIGLMAVADQVLATQRSRFGLPEASLGLLPAVVFPVLCERIPVQKARWLAMRSTSSESNEALAMGLIDLVCEDAEAVEKACRESLRALLRAHPQSIADLKRRTAETSLPSLQQALEEAAVYTASCLMLPDRVDGIRHFLQGEPLPWQERLPRKDKRTSSSDLFADTAEE
jgi:enoyl-CoA hydratase/carnithine racemase